MIKQLFEAIDCGLNQKPYHQTYENPKAFARILIENGLVGIVYEQLDLNQFEPRIQGLLTKSFYQYVSKDTKELIVIENIRNMLNKQPYPYMFLKGTHFKNIYPKSYMRGMGDIDLLVQTKDFKAVKHILRDHGFKLLSKYYYHDTYQSPEGIEIELHPFIMHEFKTSYKDFFKYPFDHVISKKSMQQSMDAAYELTYLLYHLDKHIHSGGIGLRSILDIYIYYTSKDIDDMKLKTYLEETNLLPFFEMIMQIHLYYFNQDLTSIFNFNRLTEEDMKEIITYITQSGIHGKSMNHNRFKSILATRKGDKPLKYLFKVMFPSYKKTASRYTLIKYIPILLPFYWLIRIIKLMVFKTKSTVDKLRQLRESQDDEKQMFDKLNL